MRLIWIILAGCVLMSAIGCGSGVPTDNSNVKEPPPPPPPGGPASR